MKYTLAATVLAAIVSAQTWEDINECAKPCILASVAAVTTCGATDYPCICQNRTAVTNDALLCVVNACGATVAITEVRPKVEAACAALGYP